MELTLNKNFKRIIPCLDTKGGKVVKGVKFEAVREIEDPTSLASYYNKTGADELVLYDIAASSNDNLIFSDLIKSVLAQIDIPLTVGGGISSVSDAELILSLGASKLSINSGVIKNPELVRAITARFGAVCVVSIDVKIGAAGWYEVFSDGGMKPTGINAIQWAKKLESDGACDFVLNAIDADGVKGGFDLEMLAAFSAELDTPIIASGGAGKVEDFLALFTEIPAISGGLAASVFHYKEININDLKKYLSINKVAVNL